MAKNILIFSDGTCNDTDQGYPTNVHKLYRMVVRRSSKQIAFYDPGVGTNVNRISGAAFGVGLSKNIREGYDFVVDYYQPGDSIYLFGFSRGAYTARSLAGMIHKSGILKRQHRNQVDEAFKVYKERNNADEVRQFLQNYCWSAADNAGKPPGVYFVGVWDTVSALGFPFAPIRSLNPFSRRWHGFHDAKLHEDVSFGYQALSIDDQRKVFHPEIWDSSEVEGQVVEQVWFAGVHSNVGGGYRRSGLSDVTLQWMLNKAVDAGLVLWKDHDRRVLTSPDAAGKAYDSRSGVAKVYWKKPREIPPASQVHQSVVDRMANTDSSYQPLNLPANYQVVDDDGLVAP